ncbi:MAG: pantoate--beta-alanine ligase [Actinomycetota bacterium]|nr:pantoate--beta-alanine ligase [Actinomycetota bacterium]
MRRARTIAGVRAALDPLRDGLVGLVPTMGAIHEGHLSLVAAARSECETVVVSIFVNPAQFGAGEDLEGYPRDEERDLRLLEEAGVDLVFLPPEAEIYPNGFQTWVEVTELSRGLEGEFRPGHFRGVATVCLKLFNIVRPDRVYFGQKDAQQTEVVERMIMDLDLEIELRVAETVRDADSVALSSRNVLLSQEEREAARALPRALFAGELAYRRGQDPIAATRDRLAEEPRLAPDYVELTEWNGRVVLAAAVRAGKTRLIDNVVLKGAAR